MDPTYDAQILIDASEAQQSEMVKEMKRKSEGTQLYKAFMADDDKEVVRLCGNFGEGGPLRVVTIHGDTVLHVASYSKQNDLVLDLLKMVPIHYPKLTHQNYFGNTILHEAATYDELVEAVQLMLRLEPQLLGLLNHVGETPLFRAVRYGQIHMFRVLDEQVQLRHINEQYRRANFYKNREGTILHTAIIAGHFDLALEIAKKNNYLVGIRDNYRVTALQHLARNASAFKIPGGSMERWLFSLWTEWRRLIRTIYGQRRFRVPWWDDVREKMLDYESALELAKFLIKTDATWKDTYKPVEEREGYGGKSSLDSMDEKAKNVGESKTPLFLATKTGNVEIVKEILNDYPQAVEHIDAKGRTILHMAIKYGNIDIFDLVENTLGFPMWRLVRKSDKNSNSILHMVGEKKSDIKDDEDTLQSPALQLQKDLLLYERVEEICSIHFFNHINSKGETAEKVFAKNNEELRLKAAEWLKGTAQNCSIVAVLIATVAFAAAYTLPGGLKENGVPVLLNKTLFAIFTVGDVLSLTLALTSVIIFLSIQTSSFKLKEFKRSLLQQLMLGITFLVISVSMMMLAFTATIFLTIQNKKHWTQVALYSVAFLPVTIFVFLYFRLYLSLIKTFKYKFTNIGRIFPQFSRPPKVYKYYDRT